MAGADRTSPVQIQVTAPTPVELMQGGLARLLALAREPAAAPASSSTAIPVRGLGQGLDLLFLDLAAELLAQIDEFGLGLDEIRLDGLLQTDTGGYTAWGYLTGDLIDSPAATGSLDVIAATVDALDDLLRLTFVVQRGSD